MYDFKHEIGREKIIRGKKENNNCTRKLPNVHCIKSEIYSFRVSIKRERTLFKRRQFILLEQLDKTAH